MYTNDCVLDVCGCNMAVDREDVFAAWFVATKTKAEAHDGWKHVSSTLTQEFGVNVELEQCKNKVCYLLFVSVIGNDG